MIECGFFPNLLNTKNNLIIAPAGYGKTYTIAELLKHVDKRQLILTHTNAGVASIRKKIRDFRINSSLYQVDTICGFAQRYFYAFYIGEIPSQEDKQFFQLIINQCVNIFENKFIQTILINTYERVIVDEYQDCTKQMHRMILKISKELSLVALGDPLQGTFNFNDDLVNFEEDLRGFNTFELNKPWRWEKTNPNLGNTIHELRQQLNNSPCTIQLNQLKESCRIIINNNDYSGPIYKDIMQLLEKDDVLFIHPNSTNLTKRILFIQRFKNIPIILESLYDKDFLKLARKVDSISQNKLYSELLDICCIMFNKTEIKKWINPKRFIKKHNGIPQSFKNIEKQITKINLTQFLREVYNLDNIKCYRKELFWELIKALREADINNTSVYNEMRKIREIRSKYGRKVRNKAVGTTLLTKGLEFDTVVILEAHEFKDKNNFYVAVSRAKTELIIISERDTLYF